MLLDIGSVLGGIGLAVVGFVVVFLVCVVILRLLAAILPSYENRSTGGAGDPAHDDPVHDDPAHDDPVHDDPTRDDPAIPIADGEPLE